MAKVKIETYQLAWNVKRHEGRIIIFGAGASGKLSITLTDPKEFSCMVDLLRNEKPVYYDTENALIFTGLEPIGEGEGSEEG